MAIEVFIKRKIKQGPQARSVPCDVSTRLHFGRDIFQPGQSRGLPGSQSLGDQGGLGKMAAKCRKV
jgi:hypothetical protein